MPERRGQASEGMPQAGADDYGCRILDMIELTEQNGGCRGWILYTKSESVRNRGYIDLYRAACRKYRISLQLGIYQPVKRWNGLQKQRLAETVMRFMPDFAINRTRDYRLAKALEETGVRVYNNSQITELGNDKAKACRYMQMHGIPMMPTWYGALKAPPQYPAVAKSSGGHGGTEVYLLKNEMDWRNWKQSIYRPDTDYIVQQAASDLGKDLRVYVVGGRPAACVLRSSSWDFRSNYCLGGTAGLYELNEMQQALVERIVSMFEIGMAGIDFIFHHGRMVFNEIEDAAGARSLYALTDYDIADAYVRYIAFGI